MRLKRGLVLADAVEDDDRVVERVAEDGEHRGDGGRGHLPAGERVDADDDEQVVDLGGDGADGELPLEAEGHVDEDQEQGE